MQQPILTATRIRSTSKPLPVATAMSMMEGDGSESAAAIRNEMGDAMERGVGIYRTEELMQETIDKLAELKRRFKNIKIKDRSSILNTYRMALCHRARFHS